jgi:hypothetical protein
MSNIANSVFTKSPYSYIEMVHNDDGISNLHRYNTNEPNISSFMTFHTGEEVPELFREDYCKNDVLEHFGIIEISVEEKPIQQQSWDIMFSIDISHSMSERCRDGKSKLYHIKHTMTNILRLFAKETNAIFHVCVHVFNHEHKEVFDFAEINAESVEKYIQYIKHITTDGCTNLKLPLQHSEKKYVERQQTHPENKFIHIALTDGEDTSDNSDDFLLSQVSNNYKHVFIGFGTSHNSELLELFTTNNHHEYRFIDKVDASGFIYGEIIHNLLYSFVDNIRISVENGLVYDWKNNVWSDRLDIGSMATGCVKTFHIKSRAPGGMTATLSDDSSRIFEHIEQLPGLLDVSSNVLQGNDLTQYMFRQKVQELLYRAKKRHIISLEPGSYFIKKELKAFFITMKEHMESHGYMDDIFWKVLLDDIYIVYKTVDKPFSHMYAATRQVSQGRQYSCNTEDAFDELGESSSANMFTPSPNRPRVFRQRTSDYRDMVNDYFTQSPYEEDVNDPMSMTLDYNNAAPTDDFYDDYCSDDESVIMNHSVTLTQTMLHYSPQRMTNIIDFIRTPSLFDDDNVA